MTPGPRAANHPGKGGKGALWNGGSIPHRSPRGIESKFQDLAAWADLSNHPISIARVLAIEGSRTSIRMK